MDKSVEEKEKRSPWVLLLEGGRREEGRIMVGWFWKSTQTSFSDWLPPISSVQSSVHTRGMAGRCSGCQLVAAPKKVKIAVTHLYWSDYCFWVLRGVEVQLWSARSTNSDARHRKRGCH